MLCEIMSFFENKNSPLFSQITTKHNVNRHNSNTHIWKLRSMWHKQTCVKRMVESDRMSFNLIYSMKIIFTTHFLVRFDSVFLSAHKHTHTHNKKIHWIFYCNKNNTKFACFLFAMYFACLFFFTHLIAHLIVVFSALCCAFNGLRCYIMLSALCSFAWLPFLFHCFNYGLHTKNSPQKFSCYSNKISNISKIHIFFSNPPRI